MNNVVPTVGAKQDGEEFTALLPDHRDAMAANAVHRPWGSFESIINGDGYQVKRIVVSAGKKLSLQYHHHRSEHWIVVQGTARVTCDDKEYMVAENESTYISAGQNHRLENDGVIPLELIEVQNGSYLGEDDIVRFDDVYGRKE